MGEATPLLSSSSGAHASEKKRSLKRHVLEYVGMILCLVVAGIVAWAISQKVQGAGGDEKPRPEEIVEWKSQLMGYCSAILYCERLFAVLAGCLELMGLPEVGSRIPQICESLAQGRKWITAET